MLINLKQLGPSAFSTNMQARAIALNDKVEDAVARLKEKMKEDLLA